MSSSNSPCAACKLQRRKCTQECIYAPYFPPDQPQKFANVHKVFGASNVAKLLSELNAAHREDAVNSLAYEAEARLRDPVYGCVGLISFLQQNLKQIQQDLFAAKKELAAYMGYMPQQHMAGPYDMSPMLGHPSGPSHGGQLLIRELQPQPQQYQNQQHHQKQQQQQHMLEAQEMGTNEEQEVLRNLEQQPRQQELLRFNTGFDGAGTVAGGGFNQMTPAPSLTLGKFDNPY